MRHNGTANTARASRCAHTTVQHQLISEQHTHAINIARGTPTRGKCSMRHNGTANTARALKYAHTQGCRTGCYQSSIRMQYIACATATRDKCSTRHNGTVNTARTSRCAHTYECSSTRVTACNTAHVTLPLAVGCSTEYKMAPHYLPGMCHHWRPHTRQSAHALQHRLLSTQHAHAIQHTPPATRDRCRTQAQSTQSHLWQIWFATRQHS